MEDNYIPKLEYDDHEPFYKAVKREECPVKFEEPDLAYFPPNPYLNPMAFPWRGYQPRFPPIMFNFPQYTINPFPVLKPPRKKPFIIIKQKKTQDPLPSQQGLAMQVKTEDQIQIKVEPVVKPKKKKYRTNNCKNYVGLLCAGFSRTILTAKPDSEFMECVKKCINKNKAKYETLCSYEDDGLMDSLIKYIYKVMCGKKVRKANRERDFKIRNTKDLQWLLNLAPKDNELLCLKKEVLREMMEYFFNSDYYNQWLENGMMTGPNRMFFLNNKVEIQKKVLNPGFYKPRFSNQTCENKFRDLLGVKYII